jgi:hypothetical protein
MKATHETTILALRPWRRLLSPGFRDGKKESFQTKDRKHAERLRSARNDAAEKPLLGLSLGKAYLAAYDPQLVRRIWRDVMDEFCQRGKERAASGANAPFTVQPLTR